jgi:hypothetical protein
MRVCGADACDRHLRTISLDRWGRRWYANHMDTVTRDVRDLPPAERSALDRLIGHELRETQRVVIQVMTVQPDEDSGQTLFLVFP